MVEETVDDLVDVVVAEKVGFVDVEEVDSLEVVLVVKVVEVGVMKQVHADETLEAG